MSVPVDSFQLSVTASLNGRQGDPLQRLSLDPQTGAGMGADSIGSGGDQRQLDQLLLELLALVEMLLAQNRQGNGSNGGGAAPAGSLNERIAAEAQAMYGQSSAMGPDGGNLACAYMVNKCLENAGIALVGRNTNYVPSVEAALRGGRAVEVSASQAEPGDIAIAGNEHHIGIVMAPGAHDILSNHSSTASFSWDSTDKGWNRSFGAPTRFYRLVNG